MRLAQRHVRKYPDRYRVVRYEDMVCDTEGTLRSVCAFLDEDFDPEMLGMPGAPERRDRLYSRIEQDGDASEGPLSAEFIGRFQSSVPADELAFIQLHAGRLMRARTGTRPSRRICLAPNGADSSRSDGRTRPREWSPGEASKYSSSDSPHTWAASLIHVRSSTVPSGHRE